MVHYNPPRCALHPSMLRIIITLLMNGVCCKDIFVPLGKQVFLLPEDMNIYNPGHHCTVEVSIQEPLSRNVGILSPQAFPCNFTHGHVKYSHYGSPYWKKQTIPLRVINIRGDVIEVKPSFLHIVIEEGPHSQVLWPRRSLKVKTALGLSEPLDTTVLSLPVLDTVDCRIHFSSSSNWPAYGRLVAGSQMKPVASITQRCQDFMRLGIRYEHLKASSSSADFIRLRVELEESRRKQIRSEWVQLLVEIHSNHPNEAPEIPSTQTVSLSGGHFMVPTPFTIKGARDKEFDKIIFNVTVPPIKGDIICLSFFLPCTSFDEKELIAYQPHPVGADVKPDYAQIIALDNFLQPSQPLKLVFLRSSSENASTTLSAAVIRSVLVLEGTSGLITSSNLFLPDEAKIFLAGGLYHGKIEVGGRIASYFTTSDVISRLVSYCHDDSDSTADSVHLLVSYSSGDVDKEVSLHLPVKILPKDDQAPMLVVNRELAVLEMQQVPLGPQVFAARDPDSQKRQIRYQVTGVPQNGVLIKKHTTVLGIEPSSPIRSFSEQDVDEGLIFYVHQKNGVGRQLHYHK